MRMMAWPYRPGRGDHVHVVCSRCGAERVELLDAGELARLASAN